MATESEIINYLRLRRAGKTALECKVELKLTLETMRECEHLLGSRSRWALYWNFRPAVEGSLRRPRTSVGPIGLASTLG